MARVTIEDCLDFVENRFGLVHLASGRTKQIYRGSRPLISCKNREVVTSLREIADGKVQFEAVEKAPEPKKTVRRKAKQ
ncbi:MAG: DNA-directed RNA polymerase subunit omega [Deltaproteobacteria bacterium]|nr:DNA-directed RNA polymerase subunit omega [Deltaproteobacteria bacterium]